MYRRLVLRNEGHPAGSFACGFMPDVRARLQPCRKHGKEIRLQPLRRFAGFRCTRPPKLEGLTRRRLSCFSVAKALACAPSCYAPPLINAWRNRPHVLLYPGCPYQRDYCARPAQLPFSSIGNPVYPENRRACANVMPQHDRQYSGSRALAFFSGLPLPFVAPASCRRF